MLNIENEIKNLPFVSSLIKDLKALNHNNTYDNKKLEKIIESNSLLRTSFLKLANSKLFGFESSVDTVSRAINLYGINFSLSFCLSKALISTLRVHLKSYESSFEQLDYLNELSCFLLFKWFGEDEIDLQERLTFPLLVHCLGEFIISLYVQTNNKQTVFLSLLNEGHDLPYCERKICSYSSSEISSRILENWGFSKDECEKIFYIDSPSNSNYSSKDVYILNIIKDLCNIYSPLSKKNIELAFLKADNYSLDVKSLKNAIDISLKYFNRGQ